MTVEWNTVGSEEGCPCVEKNLTHHEPTCQFFRGEDRRARGISVDELKSLIAVEVENQIGIHEKREAQAIKEQFDKMLEEFKRVLPSGDIDKTRKLLEDLSDDQGTLKELVGILKGLKFMRSTVVVVAGAIATLAGAWTFLKDHIK